MSQLTYRKFNGNSSNITNGLPSNAYLFIYNSLGNEGTDLVDLANLNFIKYHTGAAAEEEDLQMTIDWTRNSGRG